MVFKKVKKSITLTGTVFTLLIVMAVFFGMFFWYSSAVTQTGGTIDDKYLNSSSNLATSQTALQENVEDIKNSLSEVTEADSIYQATWNAFKGLGNTLKLPLSLVTTAIGSYNALSEPVDIIPNWAKGLALIGIIAVVVFLVLALLKGEPGKT